MAIDLATLIDAIHSGSLSDPPWSRFVELLGEATRSTYAVIHLRWPSEQRGGLMITSKLHPAGDASMRRMPRETDPFRNLPDRKAMTMRELLPGKEFERAPYYRDHLRHIGINDLLAINVVDPKSGIRIFVRCARVEEEGLFGDEERALFRALEPRLRVALQAYAGMVLTGYQRDVHDQVTRSLGIGTIVLNRHRHVLIANPVAQSVIDARDGLFTAHETLQCIDRESERRFHEACAALVAGEEPRERILIARGRSDGGFWSLQLRAVDHEALIDEDHAAAIIVLLKGGVQRVVPVAFLIDVFGFTAREAELVSALAGGMSIKEAAVAMRISEGTARVHLRSIFAKADVERQSQLVALVLAHANAVW
jgi:DNA-binding CsgD family transcriptional regulator